MKIPLDRQYKWDEHVFDEIDLDLAGKINPMTQEMLEGRYRREILAKARTLSAEMFGTYHEKPFVDKRFRFMVFEYVTGMPIDAIKNEHFPLKTYNYIIDSIAAFFTEWSEPFLEAPQGMEEAEEAYHGA